MEPFEGLMGSVLSKINKLLEQELNLPSGTKEKLWRVNTHLRCLRACNCSEDAWNYGLTSSTEWGIDISAGFYFLKRTMSVFYYADNLVDSILVHTEHSETAANQEGFNWLFKKVNFDAEQLLWKIRDEGYGLPYERLPDQLVGIEKPRDDLINMLAQGDDMSEPKKQMKIVSIVGIGGIGKTDLAQVVYNQIKPQFQCAAFVRAPLFYMVEFLKEMIFQFGVKNNMGVRGKKSEDEIELVSYIGSFLQNKRYLVVIDNLSDEDDWPTISRVLPNNDYGSRVITTTRMKNIAEMCCSGYDELIYEIQRLGYPDSKKLFLKKSFGCEVSWQNTSTEGFNEILKMCGGTPSAIISIAASLRTKVTATKPWQELMISIHSAWKQTATVDVNIPGFEELEDILRLTYFHLPITLKDCLLYLAVHAKNGIINRTTTVRKWIAEGFISEFGTSTPEEVASRYFDELISRNYIQLVEYGKYIRDEIYKLNYVAMYVLRQISQEINFGTVLSDISISSEYKDSVRLSIQCSGSELSVSTEKMDLYRIRSITMAGPAKLHLTNNLVYLRVLDLDGCKDLNNSAMDYICRMILLKYLSLKHTQVTEIRAEISQLRCLETLDVRHTGISNLPPEIGKLQELKILLASHTEIRCLPREIGEMQNMETLDASHTRISNLPREIVKLQGLKTLHASLTEISCLPPEIGEMQNLETLNASHTRISNLPREIGKLQELKTLHASHTEISCLPPEIGELQNLETLDASHTRISNLPPEIGSLQNLKTLDISQTQVKELPKELLELPKLAHIYYGQISSVQGVKLAIVTGQQKSVKVLIDTVESREWPGSAMKEITELRGVWELEVVLHDQPADKDQNENLLTFIAKCESLKNLTIYGDYNPSIDVIPVPPYFPLLEELKVAGRFVKVPRWLAQLSTLKKLDVRVCKLDQDDLKILGGLPGLSTLALALICIPWKKEVAITSSLHSGTCTDLPPLEQTCPGGFTSLEVFSFDCRVPWITFEQGAMARLKHLHLKLYASPADKLPSGLNNLDSLEKIILQYPSVYASSGGVTKVVAAMREEASSHRNMIGLSVNGYHEVFLPNTRVGETLTGTEIEEASNHGNRIELSFNADSY